MSVDTGSLKSLRRENEELKARLDKAEELLRASGSGNGTLPGAGVEGALPEIPAERSGRFGDEVLSQISDAVIATDSERRVIYLNNAAERQYRIASGAALGKTLDEIFQIRWSHPTDEEVAENELREKGSWRGSNIHVRTDGSEFYAESSVSRRPHDSGANGLILIVRDITERKLAEYELRKRDERYRAFIEQSTEGIWRFELEKPIPIDLPAQEQVEWAYKYGYLAECNTAMARQYGYESADDLVGARMADLYVDNDPKNDSTLLEFVESGHRITEAETHEKDINGNDKYFLNNFIGIIEDGKLVRGWGTQRDITAAKLSQKAIAHLAAIVESSDDAIISKDLDGVIKSWNDGAARLFGYSAEEAIGSPITMLLPPERLSEETQILSRIRAGEPIEHFETRRLRKDGTEIDVSLTVSPIRDENGEIIGVSKIARDITEQKHAREISERYHLLSMQARDIILFLDAATGNIVEANPAAVEAYGYDHETLLTKNIRDLRAPESLSVLEQQYKVANTHGNQFETLHKRADGSIFPVEVSAIGSDVGGERLIISIIRDITERQAVQEALSQNRAMLSLAMQASMMGAWEMDLATGTVWWSEELEEIYGLEDGGFKGTEEHFYELMHEDDRAPVWSEIQAAIDEHRPYSIEFRFHRADGSLRWLEGRGEAVYSQKGEPVRLYGVGIDITERKLSEERLRETEERFAKAFNSSPLMIAISSLETGKLIEVNDTFVRVSGYSREEAVGKTTVELGLWVNEEDREAELAAIAKEGRVRDREYEFIIRGGTRITGLLSAERIEIGGESYALTVIQDITERKLTEERIRQSGERYRNLANAMPQLVWTADSSGSVDYYNSLVANYERSGAEPGPDSWSWHLAVHPDDLPATEDAWATAVRSGRYEIEHRIKMKDGTYRWHLSRAHFVKAPGDSDSGRWFGTATDIHDHRLAQEALVKAERRANEEYFQMLSRIVPVAQALGTARDLTAIYRAVRDFIQSSMSCSAFFVSFYDAETRMRSAAYAWGEHGEVDISTLPPMKLTEDGGPNSQAVFRRKSIIVNNYMDVMSTRPHVIVHEDGINPNSSLAVPMIVMDRVIGTIEVQAYTNNAFNEEHVIALEMIANLAAVAIENVRLLEIEARARYDAEAANRMKDEFLSILSHELRTPLNAMLGWVRMLRAGILDEERSAKALEVIERNTRQQSSLIEDLLDVSRIISGKMRIEKELVDLRAIVKDASESIRPLALTKGLNFNVRLNEEALFMHGDAMRLQQVVTNLLQNAIKFTAAGGTVDIEVGNGGENASVVVRDTGVGIDPAFLPNIFDRFSQADASTRRMYAGLGLGLTIVSTIVELHGGQISVESEGLNKGATFTVKLPLAEEFYKNAGPSAVPAGEFGTKLDGVRVLLVDDDIESIIPLQIYLERQGARVVCEGSAREALARLASDEFDVLVSDIGMPEIDGYELARQMRMMSGKNSAIAAIAFTAFAAPEHRVQAFAAGFDAHISKPMDFEELLATIRNTHEQKK